jgi:hypothetical protein
LLGATNGWFPVTVTVLAIPPLGDPLSRVLDIGWNYLEGAKSVDHVEIIRGTLIKTGLVPGIERFDPEELWKAIETRRKGGIPDPGPTEEDVKRPEWVVLTHPSPPTDWPHFLSERTPPPERYRKWIREVLLLKRLREVNALVGYTRVEAPEETVDPAQRPKMADLTKGRPEWVPANEVHGEGIFLFLDESEIISWERRPSVMTRDGKLMAGHRGWRNARRLDPQAGYPGIRYTLLHTFAHLLIRELSLECGYNAASIRERIYSSQDSNSPMSGLLLYTAAADSDGTLGGLVELGRADNLERLIDRALERAAICSSDPLCSEHDPGVDRSLHLAACHACTFVAETSCERQNRYLDRALLVGTFESIDTAFFKKDDASNE